MKILVFYSVIFCSLIAQADSHCKPNDNQGPVVKMTDYSWGVTFEQMKASFKKMYNSDKRLARRAFLDPSSAEYVMPFSNYMGEEKLVKLGDRFLSSVTKNIEQALKLGYVNFVFFPDMGHSHVLIPLEFYNDQMRDMDVKDYHQLYEKMLNEESVKFLYHTAEQLEMVGENKQPLADRFLQWRLQTRNLVGFNRGDEQVELLQAPEHPLNSARSKPGYYYWGAGFALHANKNGCFSYQHAEKTYNFDLSFDDPGY